MHLLITLLAIMQHDAAPPRLMELAVDVPLVAVRQIGWSERWQLLLVGTPVGAVCWLMCVVAVPHNGSGYCKKNKMSIE